MLLNILIFRNLLVAAALNGSNQYARHRSRYVCMTDNDVDEEFFRNVWRYFYFTYLRSLAPRVLHCAGRPREGFSTDSLKLLRVVLYAQRSADVRMPHAASPPLAMQYTVVCRLLGTANESSRPEAVLQFSRKRPFKVTGSLSVSGSVSGGRLAAGSCDPVARGYSGKCYLDAKRHGDGHHQLANMSSVAQIV